MPLTQVLKSIVNTLRRLKEKETIRGFALIGGLSVSVWGVPRGTRDIDFLISLRSVDDISAFVKALKNEGLEPELHKGGFQDPIPYIVTASLQEVPLDMIISTRKWEDEAIEHAIEIDHEGAPVPVISPEYLVAMKLKAGGPRDLLDAEEILELRDLDKELLETLAKRLRVDKRLERMKRKRP
jgi:hypothetical protein